MSSENKLWLPPLSPKDQQRIDQQREQAKQLQKKSYLTWTGFKGKTLWDWLKLLAALAIPVAVAVGTLWFTEAQSQASDRANQQQHQTDLQIAADQQQEAALQTYLDRMTDLLLNDNLRTSKHGDEVREVARARTLTVLPQLNGTRKGEALQFLFEAGLIYVGSKNNHFDPVVSLYGADLRGANLENANLGGFVNMEGANRGGGVNLEGANLEKADLRGANLVNADLQGTNLENADLRGADLANAWVADLRGADLVDAYLGNADLYMADLRGANLVNAILQGANLENADLSGANLTNAWLNPVDMEGAYLIGANLIGTNLIGANLTDATVTNEQLSKAKSLKGATMPDRSRHL